MKMKLNKKGQSFSLEGILSYVIFLAIFAVILFLWSSVTTTIIESEETYKVKELSDNIVESLIRNPGIPRNWTPANVEVIGLAKEPRILDENKVLSFVGMMNYSSGNYTINKHKLNLGRRGYNFEFFFKITNTTGNVITLNNRSLVCGLEPRNATLIHTVIRTAILNDEIVKIYFTLWVPEL